MTGKPKNFYEPPVVKGWVGPTKKRRHVLSSNNKIREENCPSHTITDINKYIVVTRRSTPFRLTIGRPPLITLSV